MRLEVELRGVSAAPFRAISGGPKLLLFYDEPADETRDFPSLRALRYLMQI